MAGLLDGYFNSPESQQGLLAASAALMQAGGPSRMPVGLGQALGQAMTAGQGSYQDAMKQKMLKEKMALDKLIQEGQLEELRSKQDAAKRKQDMLAQFLGGPMSASGALDAGASRGDIGPTLSNAARMNGVAPPGGKPPSISNMSLEDVGRLKALAGVDFTELYKFANTPQSIKGGSWSRNPVTGKEEWKPDVETGMGIGSDGAVKTLPGYLEAYGSKKETEEEAKSKNTLLPLGHQDANSGKPIGGTVYDYIQSQRQPTQAVPTQAGQPELANSGVGKLSPALQQAILLDSAKQGFKGAPKVNFGGAKNPGDVYDLAKGSKSTLMSEADKKGAEATAVVPPKAQEALNATFLKANYEPVIEGGRASESMLTNVKIAQESMRALGGTGWATETKAAAANVLAGLGMATKNAELYASNAQTFQTAAASNLWTVLNAAKGVQTEKDADRAAKTFAQLKNTPRANEYILDVSQAVAERNIMKAKFYTNAMPIAQKKGDLLEVEREWNTRQPSIFDMPSMRKWGEK